MELECPKCSTILSIDVCKTCYTEESKVEHYYRILKRIRAYCSSCNLDWGFHLIGDATPPKVINSEDCKSG